MNLKDLIDKRKDVLFAEIGALIHDLGKLSKEFVEYYILNSNKKWNSDYHSKIIVPKIPSYFIEGNYVKIFEEYEKKNFSEVERLLLNEFVSRITALNTNNKIKQELEKRLKFHKKGKIKSFEQIKSSLSHKGKPYSEQNLGEKIDNELKIIFCPLIEYEHLLIDNKNIVDFLPLKINILKDIVTMQQTIANFISDHHSNCINGSIIKYLIAEFDGADGIDSGIDKMVAERATYPKQSKDHTYISTAFGYEKEKINLDLSDADKNSLTKIRKDYANTLADILNELKDKDLSSNENVKTWINRRKELLQETRNAFLNALGETRRPANDVTLWDHSFSVASLYKSALAEEIVINQWKDPKEIKWKLLSIRFDADEFYHSVNKIADVLGRKSLIKKIFENIRILLEIIIPIGNEIYSDENGTIFLVSESVDNDKLLEISDDVWDEIKDFDIEPELDSKGEWKKKKLEDIANNKHCSLKEIIESISSFISKGIFIPHIHISEPSRGALNIGKEIDDNKNRKHKIDIKRLKDLWEDKKEGYFKCSVCGVRPVSISSQEKEILDLKIKKSGWRSLSKNEKNNFKAFERKVCEDCLNSASNRVAEWKINKKWNKNEPEKPSLNTSIWIDEIADENNRIALVYISFELKKWLKGEMLNTFLSKPLLDSEFKHEFEDKLENINNYTQLVRLINEAFDKNDFNKELSVNKKDGNKLNVKELFEILGCFIQSGHKPLDVFHDIVAQREPDWQNEYKCPACATVGDNYHKAMVFLLHLTRKHPSFARLRRIWETTKNFGIEIFEETKKKLNELIELKKLKKPIRPIIRFEYNDNIRITHTYYFKDENDTKFELVITEENKAAIILNADKFKEPENGKIQLYDEDFKNIIVTLENVQLLEPKQEFYPLIPYQFEPTNTLFFMPLKYVWEVIEIIKRQYEIHFNKVQNRLPIRVGFVAFNKKMPMYVVLNAAKKMYSTKIKTKKLKVCKINEISDDKKQRIHNGKLGNYVKEIIMDDGNEYHFSYSTGDPNKKDLFHPYFIVKNSNGWKTYFDKEWQTIKHVTKLQKQDKVLFYPSQFDFLWLDSNVRRFDVGEKRRHWLFKKCSPKPYNLKDIDRFLKLKILLFNELSLTSSQIMNLYGLLISKMQEWKLDEMESLPINDSEFEGFVKNSILSIPLRLKISAITKKGEITQDDFNFFKDSILNGIFFDLIDMWHTVLKRKFKEDDNE